MKPRFFLNLVCLQILIVLLLLTFILKKQRAVFSPINKKLVQMAKVDGLKYYYEMSPNETDVADAKWLTHRVENTINNDSLNERYNYFVQKSKGIYRIITLGDSYTFGMNVNTKDNWTELLEDELNKNYLCGNIKKYEVINLGVYGYDTQYEIERYKERGQKYDPDLIIWAMFDYDRRLENVQPIVESLNKLTFDQLFTLGQSELWGGTMNRSAITRKEEISFSLALERARKIDRLHGFNMVAYQKSLLQTFHAYYIGPILFVDLGKFSRDIPESIFTDEIGKKHNYLLQTHLLNNTSYMLADWHFNEKGHEELMREIAAYLKEIHIFPCIK